MSQQCKDVLFCDDFEAHPLGAAPGGVWKTTVSSAKITVDGTKAWSGDRSVLVTVNPRSGALGAIRLAAPVLPLASNNLFGRMMLWVNGVPTAHWFNVWGEGRLPGGQKADYTIGGQNGKFILNYNPGDCWRNSVVFPAGRWACLQWQFDGSRNPDGTQKNTMRVWLDGTPIGTVVKTGSGCETAPFRSEWIAPSFEELRLGWQNPGGIQMQMWIDDVAVDGKAIPCPTKP